MRCRGEFNNARARRALVDWYLSIFVMCKARHQYNERLKALALLNSPLVMVADEKLQNKVIYCSSVGANVGLGGANANKPLAKIEFR